MFGLFVEVTCLTRLAIIRKMNEKHCAITLKRVIFIDVYSLPIRCHIKNTENRFRTSKNMQFQELLVKLERNTNERLVDSHRGSILNYLASYKLFLDVNILNSLTSQRTVATTTTDYYYYYYYHYCCFFITIISLQVLRQLLPLILLLLLLLPPLYYYYSISITITIPLHLPVTFLLFILRKII